MAVSRPRVKLFTGSPLSSDLDWDDSALINTFIASFQVLLDRDGPIAERDHEETLLLSATSPRWRNVSIRANARLQSGFSQPFLPSGGYSSNPNISFSAPPYADSFESVPEDTTVPEASYQPSTFVERDDPFLEHALAFHETLLSSQIAPVAVPEATSFTSFLTTSFGTTTTRDSTQPVEMKSSDQGTRDFVIPQSLQITPLSSLPSSAHLIAIHPQTPTPTLLCALISKSSPRIVQIRRTGGHMQLHEIIVRDETKSNLSISFWLPPLAQETHGNKFLNVTEYQQQPLRKTLEDLRIGDIVLLRNVALTAYRGVVYGQSLNPHIARARTTLDVLVRSSRTSTIPPDHIPVFVREKIERVKKWVRLYVGPEAGGERKGKRQDSLKKTSAEGDLPPDTPEG